MTSRARQSVRFLVTALALVALCGFAQGLVHALNAPRTEEAASVGDPSRDPVPVAKPIVAGGVVLDEARVRQIAREEADAALVRAKPKKPAPKPDNAADDADAAAPMSVKPVEPAPIPPVTPSPGPQ